MTKTMDDVVEVMARALRGSYDIDIPAGGVLRNPKYCALEQIEALREAGFAVVPVEPTEAMLDAYCNEAVALMLADKTLSCAAYRAMIAAAQESK